MNKTVIRLLAVVLMFSIFLSGCSSAYQIKKIKKRWNIPENEDIRITLVSGDAFDFQKDEYKVFNELQVLKGLGIKTEPERAREISQVVIPLDDIYAVEVLSERNYKYLITAGVVGGIGTIVYLLLSK